MLLSANFIAPLSARACKLVLTYLSRELEIQFSRISRNWLRD